MAMSAGTSSSLLDPHISLSSFSSLRPPLYSPSGSLGRQRVTPHLLRHVIIRENATPSLAHLIVRHAIAPCHCLRLSSTPIAWHAITPCSPSLSSSFIVVIAAKPRNLLVFLHRHGRMVPGRRSRRLLIIICQVYLFLLSSQNASSSSLRGNATASFSPMCIPTVNDDDEGFVESLNSLD